MTKTHKLMIKTHNKTGLKYLCYTRSEGKEYTNYKGSGKLWKKHLDKYGEDITTELIFETVDKDEFKKVAIAKSLEFCIVDSNEWANLKIEEGDGGDTVSNKQWITNGETDRYILKTEKIPEGWRKGRSRCIFNDPENQRKFSSMADLEKRGKAIKQAWKDGKMDHRDTTNIGCKGHSEETKHKLSIIQKANKKELSERMKRNEVWKKSGRWKNKQI